ncbi:hypothetical protein PV433_11720 [Paenibacillus sp. GYB004]|uniref:hypothetical protein n=1 Tax=Paenibacillus sp. GYB004 TaxID=2994393 RepID=UPI002F9641E3
MTLRRPANALRRLQSEAEDNGMMDLPRERSAEAIYRVEEEGGDAEEKQEKAKEGGRR